MQTAHRNDPAFSPARLCIFIALSLAVMAVIFVFSAQDSEQSSVTSSRAAELLWRILSPVLWSGAADFIINNIRKEAHMFIYFVLGIFAALSAAELSLKIRRPLLCFALSWLVCILYAVSDEFHQSFTPGRFPSPKDVIIDSAGALISITAVGLICIIKRRRFNAGARSVP